MIREIGAERITQAVARLCIESNCVLDENLLSCMQEAAKGEEGRSRLALELLVENARLAAQRKQAVCQDTGMTVVFLDIGQDVHIFGGDLYSAINKGVAKAYKEGYFRSSIVDGPLDRKNTGDNTPAVIHTEIVPGDQVKVVVAPKGFGSENMSAVAMLKPAEGVQGVKDFVVRTIKNAGANPCPPIVVGIGIGGTLEKAALLSKKALLRPAGQHHPDEKLGALESELLGLINEIGIGPQGFGGRTTALAVAVETYPTHIAGLPVSVNICCHVCRHAEEVI